MVVRPLLALFACACGAATAHVDRTTAHAGDDVTLYRGVALVRQRLELDVGRTPTVVKVAIARGVTAAQIVVVDPGDVTLDGVRGGTDAATGGELEIVARAPRRGRHTIAIAYTTDRLRWDAAYTMTTTPARDRAVLRGALAIRNSTGLPLLGATVRVVDADLAVARTSNAQALASELGAVKRSTSAKATPRELGRLDLADGETRVELVGDAPPRAMRSVLVYDPIGTKLDQPSSSPSRDPALGVHPAAPTRVTESFEIERDEALTAGLPGGPVRLLERRRDGSLAVLGESRLFDASMRDAAVDTISIGTAEGITAKRERRELTIDDMNRRLVEEFAIAIDNQRERPARVLIREHLYRGLNWHLAYPVQPIAEKEGDQQIALRAIVPAHAKANELYVVVYTWDR